MSKGNKLLREYTQVPQMQIACIVGIYTIAIAMLSADQHDYWPSRLRLAQIRYGNLASTSKHKCEAISIPVNAFTRLTTRCSWKYRKTFRCAVNALRQKMLFHTTPAIDHD